MVSCARVCCSHSPSNALFSSHHSTPSSTSLGDGFPISARANPLPLPNANHSGRNASQICQQEGSFLSSLKSKPETKPGSRTLTPREDGSKKAPLGSLGVSSVVKRSRFALRAQSSESGEPASATTSAVRENLSDNFQREEIWNEVVPAKLAVFVSGGGSNFKAIQKAIEERKILGKVACVVTDRPECGGSKFAVEKGIEVLHFPLTKFCPDALSTQQLIDSLDALGVDYIILAGYLRLLPPELVQFYSNSILNIHPSLLPAFGGKGFYGMKVHEAVIASGARFSGATVHFVDDKYDNGAIVAQALVHVSPFDSPEDLQKRVLQEEHKLYVHVVTALCAGCIKWTENGVPYISIPCSNSSLL